MFGSVARVRSMLTERIISKGPSYRAISDMDVISMEYSHHTI
jgi:hypothetical protein